MTAALTPRQRQILSLAADGAENTEIGAALHLDVETVKTHMKKIYRLLEVRNRTAAVFRAVERGDLVITRSRQVPTPAPVRQHASGAIAVCASGAAQDIRPQGMWRIVRAGGSYYDTQWLDSREVATWSTLWNHHHDAEVVA